MMKRFLAAAMAILLVFVVSASAQVTDLSGDYLGQYKLEPGLYRVGEDIPSGYWDVRFHDLNGECTIVYSDSLDASGRPDLSNRYSYSFTFSADQLWQGMYAVILTFDYGYLEVLHSPCTIYEID